jgi:ribulose-phosphate 3-epimerase
MVEVVPAILVGSFEELSATLSKVRGLAPWAQIDVCDGFFVPTRTWPMNPGDKDAFQTMVKEKVGLPFGEDFNFEVDLMVENAERVIPDWLALGAERVAIHIEARHDFAACRRALGDGIEFGIALVNDTPLARLLPYRGQFDYLQLMGIAEIGRQGLPFDERVLERIREAKAMFPGVPVQIDGSVNGETAWRLVAAGADRLVSGSYILHAGDLKKAIDTLAHA